MLIQLPSTFMSLFTVELKTIERFSFTLQLSSLFVFIAGLKFRARDLLAITAIFITIGPRGSCLFMSCLALSGDLVQKKDPPNNLPWRSTTTESPPHASDH